MNQTRLYRRRFIPNEITYLKDDEILLQSNDLIITKWNTLKPRKDFSSGISAYFIKEGYKVSKILDSDGNVVFWYCDIINTRFNPDYNSIIFEDLLLDVIVYENGTVQVVDSSELADAFDSGLITNASVSQALHALDRLLRIIYSGNFASLQMHINKIEQL